MPKEPLPATASVSILVRDDVAVLTFGRGADCDQACAATIQEQVYGSDHAKYSCATLGSWGRDSSYLSGPRLFVHADQLSAVVAVLKRRGYWVEVDTYTGWPHGAMKSSVQPSMEHRVVERVHQQPWGQILVPQFRIVGVVAELAQAYGTQNILVIAKNNAMVRDLRRRLKRTIPQVIDQQQRQVHVQALAGLDRASHDWQVLIFADLESARSDTGMQQACCMPDSVIYAIMSSAANLDWEDRLRLRVACGPVIHREIEAPFTNATVVVVNVRAPRLRMGVPRNPLMRKRLHIWRNVARCQQVAKLAVAFATGNTRQLDRCGIPVDLLQQLAALGKQLRVAIIVENVEHARFLRQHLPAWRMATGARYADMHSPQFPMDEQRVIITLTRARAAGVVADVIIRADGTEQRWRLGYGPHFGFSQDSMFVVDILDGFDARCYDCGRLKKADYNDRGWQVIDAVSRRNQQQRKKSLQSREILPAKKMEGSTKEPNPFGRPERRYAHPAKPPRPESETG